MNGDKSIDYELPKVVYEVTLFYIMHVKAYTGAQDLGRECTALPILSFVLTIKVKL